MRLCISLATAVACLAAASPARAASFVNIIDPLNPAFTEALGINNSGTVVGYGTTTNPNGFQLTPPSTFTRQNVPGANGGTKVTGVDSTGNTVGSSVTSGPTSGFYQSGGTFTTTNQPGTVFNQLLGINQTGTTAAGYSSVFDPFGTDGQRAFTVASPFSSPVFTNIAISLPANINSQATGVNNSGLVAGFYENASTLFTAFSKLGGSVTTFQFPGSVSTQALGVNNLGQIVGNYIDANGVMHGFFDNGGVFMTLDPPGATGTAANGINDLGQIVGFYTNANNATIGFETQISETPLPAALPLFATGLGALGLLGWRRKRKFYQNT
jgi:hypothetical protein